MPSRYADSAATSKRGGSNTSEFGANVVVPQYPVDPIINVSARTIDLKPAFKPRYDRNTRSECNARGRSSLSERAAADKFCQVRRQRTFPGAFVRHRQFRSMQC